MYSTARQGSTERDTISVFSMQAAMRTASKQACGAFRATRPGPPYRPQQSSRSVITKAYVEASVTYAVTQQAIAYAAVLGVDAYLERDSKAAPDLKTIGAGAGATMAAVAVLNTGIDFLSTVGLILGVLASGAMLTYHAKRTADANDADVDWPGPKAGPATMALISFFALNAFVQGIRAGI